MISIKLKRIGKKKQPFYHLIAIEKLSYIKGKYIEKLGYFNPITIDMKLDLDRINYWKMQGASLSKRVCNIIKTYNKKNNSI